MKWLRCRIDGIQTWGLLESDSVVVVSGSPFGEFTISDRRIPAATIEWLTPCQFALGPCGGADDAGLVNANSNNYVALRVQNATADTLFAEYRPSLAPLAPASTNWTEAYDLAADPFQMVNIAVKGRAAPGALAALREELWRVAACEASSCP
jgi:hypothetical protein